jgi:hypothetical protein
MRRTEVTPKAEALSSNPRREAFQDDLTEVMAASLRSGVIEGCPRAPAQANKALKIFERVGFTLLYAALEHGPEKGKPGQDVRLFRTQSAGGFPYAAGRRAKANTLREALATNDRYAPKDCLTT